MNLTIWGINYLPEVTGIAPCNAALCDFLRAQGHAVRMLTTFAYYPAWRKSPADRGRLYRTDDVGGVPVHRCWHYVPRHCGALKRMVHEASFVLTSFLRLLFLSRPDALVVVSPPLLLGAAAWLAARLKSCRVVFHVQDLQPDAAVGLGMLRPSFFTRQLYALETLAYRKADRVSGISQGMLEAFTRKGVPREKQVYFPNGVELPGPAGLPPRGNFRRRHGLADSDFLAVYSGNMGVKQGLEILVAAAALVRNPQVRIILCGDGAQRETLAERVKSARLANVLMLPLQPEEQFVEMLVDADLAVITQQKGSGAAFFPSKLLRNLALAVPILTVAETSSGLAHALAEAGCGVNVEPEQPEVLARAIERLAEHPAQLRMLSQAGRKYVEQFEMSRVLAEFETELKNMVGEPATKLGPVVPGAERVSSPLIK